VPESLADDEGPWKLLAWLDQIQPPLDLGGVLFPSYSLKLLLDHLSSQKNKYGSLDELRDALLGLADEALKAEEEHLLHTVDSLLDATRERLDALVKERLEALDTYFEGLGLGEEEGAAPRNPRELLDELVGAVHVAVRLSPEEQRLLRDDPGQVRPVIHQQVENAVIGQSALRLVGAIERRLEDSLELEPPQLAQADWEAMADQVYQAVQAVLSKRRERLMGNGAGPASGQLSRDLEAALAKINGPINTNHMLGLLLMMPQGSRATFDKKTHRRVLQRTTRLTYIYLASRLLEKPQPEDITEDVLKHLQSAQATIRRLWGASEFQRLEHARLPELEPQLRDTLCTLLGEETCNRLQTQPLQSLDRDQVIQVMDELGGRPLTEIYRQLLLGVITELWVDYLTQMEALRVSIGLEAYGQRDPLVQYKSKAFELFQNLLKDMRSGVISRMFIYRPRDMSAVQSEVRRSTEPQELEPEAAAGSNGGEAVEAPAEQQKDEKELEPEEEQVPEPANPSQSQLSRSQKRRRHRR